MTAPEPLVQLLCPGVRRTSHGRRLCRRPLLRVPRTWQTSLDLRVLDVEHEARGTQPIVWCRGCEHWIELGHVALRVA